MKPSRFFPEDGCYFQCMAPTPLVPVQLDKEQPVIWCELERSSERGIEAVHTAEVGLAAAPDPSILAFAREENRVVETLAADFRALLVRSGEGAPSVIRLRIDRATAELVTERVVLVLDRCREGLENGAMVSTNAARVRVRRLVATR